MPAWLDLLKRSNHTGQQALSTISDAGGAAALNVGTTAGTVAAGDHTHPASGGAGALLQFSGRQVGATPGTWYAHNVYGVFGNSGNHAQACGTGATPIISYAAPGYIMPRSGQVTDIHFIYTTTSAAVDGEYALFASTRTDGSATTSSIKLGSGFDFAATTPVVGAANKASELGISTGNAFSAGDELIVAVKFATTIATLFYTISAYVEFD